jgi:hypothetical protein
MSKIRPAQLSLFLVALAMSASARALPPNEVTTEYYADATHSRLVGESILACGGGIRKWGHKTRFQLKTSDPCGKRVAAGSIPAAHFLMHRDPVGVCRRKCEIKYPVTTCGADEVCNQARAECEQACDLLLTPEE